MANSMVEQQLTECWCNCFRCPPNGLDYSCLCSLSENAFETTQTTPSIQTAKVNTLGIATKYIELQLDTELQKFGKMNEINFDAIPRIKNYTTAKKVKYKHKKIKLAMLKSYEIQDNSEYSDKENRIENLLEYSWQICLSINCRHCKRFSSAVSASTQ